MNVGYLWLTQWLSLNFFMQEFSFSFNLLRIQTNFCQSSLNPRYLFKLSLTIVSIALNVILPTVVVERSGNVFVSVADLLVNRDLCQEKLFSHLSSFFISESSKQTQTPLIIAWRNPEALCVVNFSPDFTVVIAEDLFTEETHYNRQTMWHSNI